jgi:hypothetical protein
MVVVEASPLLAVTIRQPWAWSIRFAQSPILNTDWRPPSRLADEYIGLHVGKSWTKRERLSASLLSSRYHPELEVPLSPEGYLFSHLFAVGRVAGFVDMDSGDDRGDYSRIVETSRGRAWVGGDFSDEDVERMVTSKWWHGPCGWVLRHVRHLPEPIALAGKPKLWSVPANDALNAAAQVGV